MKSEEKMMEPQIIAPSLMGSCRLTISLIISFGAFAGILQTINLSMAIVCLNQHSKSRNVTEDCNCTLNSEFNALNGTFEETSQERGMYLDKTAQGMLLGALYYGVVPVQVLVGWLCDKYGINKLEMYVGSGLLAFSSLLTPIVLEFGGVPYYFALRVIKGITMSFALSSMVPLLTSWTTKAEQGLLMGISSAGMGVANAVTYPISGMLCRYSGWKSIFYFGGVCGLLSTLLVIYFVYDTPAKHPRVGVEEKQYILAHQIQSLSSKKSRVIPWSKMFLSIPVWAVVLTTFFFFAVAKGTVLNLPIFVKDVLDFTVTENGVFSAMPLVGALVVHIVAGPMFDYVRTKYPSSVTTVRKIFQAIGTVAPAALMFVCSQLTPEHKYYIISMITIGYSLNEFAVMGGYWYTMMDIAPDFVGILQGLNKTLGLAPGFIIPPIIATLTPNGTSEEWSHVFLLFGGLYLASCLTYVIFGSAKLQSWGKAEKDSITKETII